MALADVSHRPWDDASRAALKEALAGDDTGLDGVNALLNSVYAGLKQQTAGPVERIADRPGKER